MGIYIGGPGSDYSAMQGPCPTGFHVPSKDEWVSVKAVRTTLGGGGAAGTGFRNRLLLPFAGSRSSSSGAVSEQDTSGYYRSVNSSSNANATLMKINSSTLSTQSSGKNYGFSIRPFKDTPVTPDSSWTLLYGTSIEDGGIFRSEDEGLISMSSDGQTWITIADKNLGATTVYSNGDTLSQDNCGYYYQWGNNYGFAWTGSITTSSTQVDASSYGPGNYYSSSTFIVVNVRDSSYNGNLWGGETGIIEKSGIPNSIYIGTTSVSEVYVGTTKVRPSTVPALCFTAEQANSTITLNKTGNPTAVNIETSTNGSSWSDYTFGAAITLNNVGDSVYFRNKSETATGFSTYFSTDYYSFSATGVIGCSGDVGYLLCKNGTDTITSDHCFARLFYQCTGLTKSPSFSATTIKERCYYQCFRGCTSLKQIPALAALSLTNYGYSQMFYGCSLIKLSTTQNADYTQPYRIPVTGTGTVATNSLQSMFSMTGGTFTGNPTINTTYYLHKDNTIV